MSVIFNSLRKMQERSSIKKDSRKILRTKQKKHFFNKTLFSPKFVIILSVCIFFIGFAALFGVQLLKNQVTQKMDKPGMSKAPKIRQPVSKPAEIKTNIVYLVRPQMPAPPEKDTANIDSLGKYLPPDPDLALNSGSENGYSKEKSSHFKLNKKALANTKDQSFFEKPPTSFDQSQHQQTDRFGDSHIETKQNYTVVDKPAGDKQTRDKQAGVTQILPPIPRDEKKPDEPDEDSKKEGVFASNAQKSSDISRLVIQVRRAMQENDNTRVDEIIKKLTQLKGEENSYVLKIKAFWYIRKGDYDSASAFLNKVLEKNESDLEAGINLAVVEIKTSRFKEARIRLMQLQEKYPHNIQIPELIQKLRL